MRPRYQLGGIDRRALALAHSNRGIEWTARGDLDRAIANYDEAIRLAPDAALARAEANTTVPSTISTRR